MFNWFKKDKEIVDLKFVDRLRITYPHNPPVLAKTLKPAKKHQEEKYGTYKLSVCPGMWDYSQFGYIIPAWTKIHIKANKAGTVVMLGTIGPDREKRPTHFINPPQMEMAMTDGIFNYESNVTPAIHNCNGPWSILGKNKNVSCFLMPPFFHANYLDDLHQFPGIVDYTKSGFSTINFVFAPKRACEVTINEGDPLIHVIPFLHEKPITASYGPATEHEKDFLESIKFGHEKHFYRKFYRVKKYFGLVPDYE